MKIFNRGAYNVQEASETLDVDVRPFLWGVVSQNIILYLNVEWEDFGIGKTVTISGGELKDYLKSGNHWVRRKYAWPPALWDHGIEFSPEGPVIENRFSIESFFINMRVCFSSR
jgi:hypothetical protein